MKHNPQLLDYQAPRTATGRISTAEDAWQEYIAYDSALIKYFQMKKMKEVIPDVEIEVKCNGVMKHWHKEVELKYVNDDQEKGQIIPSD